MHTQLLTCFDLDSTDERQSGVARDLGPVVLRRYAELSVEHQILVEVDRWTAAVCEHEPEVFG